ncbi:MAG: DUF4238 domain-containing protein [Patescibacteria group bacterium]
MSKKKIGHHWLSEAYLRNFCNSKNQVCVLTPQNRIYETSPHNICKENHYNTVNGSLIIEDSLSVIEGEVFKIINGKIKEREILNNEEKLLLAYYVSIIFCRVRGRREWFRKSYEDIINWMGSFKQSKKFQEASLPASGNGRTYKLDDMKKTLKNFNQRFAVSSMNLSEYSLGYIVNMKWVFFTAPKDSFISSDDPVRLCRPEAEKKYGPLATGSLAGLKHEDVELTFPITPDTLLGASWKIKYDLIYTPIRSEKIFGINRRTIRHAKDLFATNKQILEHILQEDKKIILNK